MSIGSVFTLAVEACAAFTSAAALYGYVRIARTRGGWRDTGCWLGPLVLTSAAFALLAMLGVLGPVSGTLLALAPLAVIGVRVSRAWREVAKRQGRITATRRVLSGIAARVRDVLWNAWQDLRDLAGRVRREPLPAQGENAPAVAPAPAAPSRQVPPAQTARPAPPAPPAGQPPAGGSLPDPVVSPGWAGLCMEIDGFDADTDEEVLGFIAAQMAGHIAHAGSVRDLADRLLHGTGLDPAFAQGVAEYADENADMTGAVTMLDRQFHAIYDTLREWVEEHPMGMPHRAREFLQGGEPPLPDAGDDDEGMAA